MVTYNESLGESWTLMRKKMTIRVQNKSTAGNKMHIETNKSLSKIFISILSNCCFYIELNSLAYKDFMDVIC